MALYIGSVVLSDHASVIRPFMVRHHLNIYIYDFSFFATYLISNSELRCNLKITQLFSSQIYQHDDCWPTEQIYNDDAFVDWL